MWKQRPDIFVTGAALGLLLLIAATGVHAQEQIQHDAEHYMLLAQHGDRWAQEDEAIAEKLEEVRDANGGKRPNVLFVLIDDVGFGEMGDPVLNHVRGYTTPNINAFARESLTFSRMYSEPTCTPTRTALLTGRLPVRSHMLEPKIVPPEGTGLHGDEVTLAELLKKVGYNTAHIGKWHQGDIQQAMPHNQGFDTASYPVHNQATFNFMTNESEEDRLADNVAVRETVPNYRMDKNFRPAGWVLGVDAVRGEDAHEWGAEAGKPLDYAYYDALNEHYKELVVERLNQMAAMDEPFFLNYWPQIPVSFTRRNRTFKTANGGTWVESMKELDDNLGVLFAALKDTGVEDNTIVVVMSDNGPMMQAMPDSGYSQLVFRGFKGDTLEGGIRVNAYVRWPGVIQPDNVAGDIVHATDMYTTLATIAQADDHIPRDRVVDGLNQTSLFLNGDGYGRRDYIFAYEGAHLQATIKEQFKTHWPAPGSPGFALPVFDLYRDVKETKPLLATGMWSVAYFSDMRERHMALKKKYPDRQEIRAQPYEGIADLRPETEALLEYYNAARKAAE
jgi:arylsulfatase A-like enzyme